MQLRPLTLGELLDAAFKIYRQRARTLMLAVAIPVLPVLIFSSLVEWSTQPDDYNPFDFSQAQQQTDVGESMLQLAGTLVSSLALLFATSLATAACFRAISSAYLGDEVTWRESLQFARSHVWRVLGLTLLVLLLTIVGILGCFVGIVLPLGFYAVVTPALLMEGTSVTGAMRRSIDLVRGRFWKVVLAVIVSTLLASVVQGVLVAPALALYATDLPSLVIELINMVLTGIALVLVTPWLAAFTMALYVDLRVRKEGFDLYLWARRVGTESTSFPQQPGAPVWGPTSTESSLPPPPAPPGPGFGPPRSGFGPDER